MFICHVQQPSVVRDENGRSNMLLLVRAPVLTCHSTANKTCVACVPAILADVLTEEHYITKKKEKRLKPTFQFCPSRAFAWVWQLLSHVGVAFVSRPWNRPAQMADTGNLAYSTCWKMLQLNMNCVRQTYKTSWSISIVHVRADTPTFFVSYFKSQTAAYWCLVRVFCVLML